MFTSQDNNMAAYCGSLVKDLADSETGYEILVAFATHLGKVEDEKVSKNAVRGRKVSAALVSATNIFGIQPVYDEPDSVEVSRRLILSDPDFALQELTFTDPRFDVAKGLVVVENDRLGTAYECIRKNAWTQDSFSIFSFGPNRYGIVTASKSNQAMLLKLSLP